MTFIDLRFSTGLTARGPALNAIALEIKQAFNLVAARYHQIKLYEQTLSVGELKAELP